MFYNNNGRWRHLKKVDSNDLLHCFAFHRIVVVSSISRLLFSIDVSASAKENEGPVLVFAGIRTYDLPHP